MQNRPNRFPTVSCVDHHNRRARVYREVRVATITGLKDRCLPATYARTQEKTINSRSGKSGQGGGERRSFQARDDIQIYIRHVTLKIPHLFPIHLSSMRSDTFRNNPHVLRTTSPSIHPPFNRMERMFLSVLLSIDFLRSSPPPTTAFFLSVKCFM